MQADSGWLFGNLPFLPSQAVPRYSLDLHLADQGGKDHVIDERIRVFKKIMI